MTNEEIAVAWNALSYEDKANVLGEALAHGIKESLEGYDVRGLGQDFLTEQATRILKPLLPALGKQLAEVAKPAAEKAAEAIKPMLEKQMDKYVPIFAIFAGLAAGFFTVIGMLLIKKWG